MAVYTDSTTAAAALLQPATTTWLVAEPAEGHGLQPLLASIFSDVPAILGAPTEVPGWPAVLVRSQAPRSQFDAVIDLVRSGVVVPDRTVCVAGRGTDFHGFRGRTWAAVEGNLHVTVHLSPRRPIRHFDTVFTALAAVVLAEASVGVPGLAGRVAIKWVNDVLVDGAKVGGVLAHTTSRGDVVESVVLGMGLNVEAAPDVERSPSVPAVGALRQFAALPAEVTPDRMLAALLSSLDLRYTELLQDGHEPVMRRYRAASAVLGQEVTVLRDAAGPEAGVLAAGRVLHVGDGLELHISGTPRPVRSGRLLMGNAAPEAS